MIQGRTPRKRVVEKNRKKSRLMDGRTDGETVTAGRRGQNHLCGLDVCVCVCRCFVQEGVVLEEYLCSTHASRKIDEQNASKCCIKRLPTCECVVLQCSVIASFNESVGAVERLIWCGSLSEGVILHLFFFFEKHHSVSFAHNFSLRWSDTSMSSPLGPALASQVERVDQQTNPHLVSDDRFLHGVRKDHVTLRDSASSQSMRCHWRNCLCSVYGGG